MGGEELTDNESTIVRLLVALAIELGVDSTDLAFRFLDTTDYRLYYENVMSSARLYMNGVYNDEEEPDED